MVAKQAAKYKNINSDNTAGSGHSGSKPGFFFFVALLKRKQLSGTKLTQGSSNLHEGEQMQLQQQLNAIVIPSQHQN